MWAQCILLIYSLCCSVSGALEYRNDYTYYPKAKGWFKVHQMPSTWYDATDICHDEGAELVSPLNEGIMSVVQELINNEAFSLRWHITYSGVHNTFGQNLFSSLGGIPMDNFYQHVKWADNHHTIYEKVPKCLVYTADGMSECRIEDNVHPFICYREFRESVLSDCGTVDTEYIFSRRTGQCYKHHYDADTWPRAQQTCQAEGGHLAIINSETEANLLTEIVSESPRPLHTRNSDTLLLGFLEWGRKHNWRTIHGESLKQAGFNKWLNDDNFEKTLDCGGFTEGKLNIVSCDEPLAYICEKTVHSLTNSTGLTNSLHSRL